MSLEENSYIELTVTYPTLLDDWAEEAIIEAIGKEFLQDNGVFTDDGTPWIEFDFVNSAAGEIAAHAATERLVGLSFPYAWSIFRHLGDACDTLAEGKSA